ncbi:hypothetical protein [Polluticoccus soli]|uniref:hypothetical protein n=1 Tax=Polluticoccus soli TaxID=3034150 RepID=UPI0023E32CB4|nr:hypothetical protein [Flavipsychrobacter sp. JY13-12]
MPLTYLLTTIATKILALFIGLAFFRRMALPYRLALLQVFLGMMAEVGGWYIAAVYREHNLWLFNWYWLTELWVMGTTGILLLKNRVLQKGFLGLLLIPTALWVYFISINGIDMHPAPALTAIGTTLIVIFIAVLFHASFTRQALSSQPVFWLSLSVLIFFGGIVPYYSMFNYLYTTNPVLLEKLFIITEVLNHLRYPMVAIGLFLAGRQHLATVKLRNHV